MNWYRRFAILLLVLGIASVVAIWAFDPNDAHYKQIDLTLKVAAAIGTISGIYLAVVGAARGQKPQDQAYPPRSSSASQPQSDLEAEIQTYLANLERILSETSLQPEQFVELSAEAASKAPEAEFELLQNFEWSRKETQAELDRTTREPMNLLEAQKRFERFVLLGDPGAGKTTCLQYIARRLVVEYRDGTSDLVPLFLSFSRWTDVRMDALTFLRESFARIGGANSALAANLDALLSAGRMVVILDGLNEMPGRRHDDSSTERPALIQREILSQLTSRSRLACRQDPRERSLRELATLSAVRSHFIISCRTHEFFQSPSWQEVYVLPMDESQILRFIGKYLPSGPAEALSSQLAKTPPLKSLAQNPFFLRSMTRINTSRLTSVGNKGQFLERLYEELLQRETARGLPISYKKITKTVAKLAHRMIRRDMIGSQIDLRLKDGRGARDFAPLLATGLLQSKQDGAVVFYHQLIQEFFAALALRERWVRQRLSILLLHKKWSEVIILWHDIERRPERLLSRLIDKLKQRNVPFAKPRTTTFPYNLFCIVVYNAYAFFFTMVLIDVVAGGGSVLSAVLHHQRLCLCFIIGWPICVRPVWRLCYYNGAAIGNAAYIISRVGSAIAIEPLITAFRRTRGMTGAAYRKQVAEALATFGPEVAPRLIAELSSSDRWRRVGCIEALGIISDRRAFAPLLELLRGGDEAVLSASIEALTRIGGPEAGPAVASAIQQLDGVGIWGMTMLTGSLKMSLQQFRECDKELISSLKRAAAKGRAHFYRSLAIQALGAYGHAEGVTLLEEIAKDSSDDYDLRQTAVLALSFMRGSDGASALLRLYDQVPNLRSAILKAVGAIQSTAALDVLRLALGHAEAPLRRAAVRGISLVGSAESISPLLLGPSQDAAPDVREETAWALARKHSVDGADTLKKLCRDGSEAVRVAAMGSLDYAFPEVAREALMELAADNRFPDRSKAIELLSQYRFPEVRKLLTFLCGDLDSNVKQRAAESLTRMDASLSVELKHVRVVKGQTIPRRLLKGLGQLIGVEEFKRLVLEERLRGAVGADPWFKAVGRIQADAELKRRFRIATSLVVGGFVCLFTVFPGAALAIALRGLLFSGGILWHGKWIILSVVAIALSTFLPAVKRLFKVGKARRALWTARVVGILTALLCFGALVVAYWWIGGIVLLLGAVGIWWTYRRVHRVLRNFLAPAPAASSQEQAQGAEPKAPAAQ